MDQRAAGCECPICAGGSQQLDFAGDGLSGLPATKPVQSLDWVIANFSRSNAKWPQGATITYSFRESLPPTPDTDITFQAYSPTERMFARMAFDLISDVCNLTFVEAPDDGVAVNLSNRIYFGHDTTREQPGVWGYVWRYGGSNISAAEIWSFTETVNARAWIVGGLNFNLLMHEQLHTLGIPHPGSYDILSGETITFATHAQYAQDTAQFTVMSYFGASNSGSDYTADSLSGTYSAATLMLHDVAALQALYGANMNTRAGDTVYGYNSNTGRPSYTIVPGSTTADTTVNSAPIFCIWDGGGTDLIDLSLTAFAVNLDLRPGHFSDAFEMTNNISIAYGVVIENARGGSAADRIVGNAAANVLFGGLGNDVLDGGAGVDTAAYEGLRRAYAASAEAVSGPEGSDTLLSIEVLSFLDGRLSFDLEGAAAAVYGLYDAAFDRAPDGWGFNAWLRQNQAGMSLDAVAAAFAGSAEFVARYGGLSDRAFVEQMYRNALGREGEAAGVDAWTALLAQGADRGDVVRGFASSVEHRGLMAPAVLQGLWIQDEDAVEIARLYDAAFGRLPDQAGAVAWIRQAHAGTSLLDIAEGFAGSAEFAGIYGGLDDRGFLEELYRVSLGREADQGGLDAWLAWMAQGHGRAEVLVGFSESQENQITSQGYVDGGLWFG